MHDGLGPPLLATTRILPWVLGIAGPCSVEGRARSAFFMTEPAAEGGAGSDPSMMLTTCRPDGNHWVINGRKAFITGAAGAKVGIVMAKADEGACMFLVDLPDHREPVGDRITADNRRLNSRHVLPPRAGSRRERLSPSLSTGRFPTACGIVPRRSS